MGTESSSIVGVPTYILLYLLQLLSEQFVGLEGRVTINKMPGLHQKLSSDLQA
jgi:hypothetical protein